MMNSAEWGEYDVHLCLLGLFVVHESLDEVGAWPGISNSRLYPVPFVDPSHLQTSLVGLLCL